MKGSLKLRPKRILNRKEAWACFSANLALPGSGSLAAGLAVGYFQLAVAFLADAICVVTAIPMLRWGMSGRLAVLQSPSGDPFEYLPELWLHVRGPLAGVGVLVVAILWATTTSRSILAKAPKEGVPPRIT
jgi:hypothetical protein